MVSGTQSLTADGIRSIWLTGRERGDPLIFIGIVWPDLGRTAKEEPAHQKRLLMLGQMLEMLLYKSEQYGLPLPPGLNRLKVVGS